MKILQQKILGKKHGNTKNLRGHKNEKKFGDRFFPFDSNPL